MIKYEYGGNSMEKINSEEKSVFISYSQKDKDHVIPIASYLARLGLRVWMDTKELSAGQNLVEEISYAINNSDIYIIIISPSALDSNWVTHELNTALTLEINQGKPKVLPIIVEKTNIPISIKSRLYIDMSDTLDSGKTSLLKAIKKSIPNFSEKKIQKKEKTELILESVVLQLRSETHKFFGVNDNTFTKESVKEEVTELIKDLRRKAHGILLNFLSASEMDFSTPNPKFPNGELYESIIDSPGDLIGTFTNKAVVDLEIIDPDEKKLNKLISENLESLGVSRIIYSFLVSPPIAGLDQQTLQRLQKEYIILGWDQQDGADVELPDDLKLSVACTEERINIGIETKYSFQFETRAKEFSVRQFVMWLIE